MITPDVIIRIYKEHRKVVYRTSFRVVAPLGDCYVLAYIVTIGGETPEKKRYHFHVYQTLGTVEAMRLCEEYFKKLYGYAQCEFKGFEYIP